MKVKFLQNRGHALLVHLFIILAFLTSGYVSLPQLQQQGPVSSFVIVAPAQVALGDQIEIQMIVDHADDLAGYEAQLLFDTSAAHFSGLQQRNSDLKKFGRDVIPLEAPVLPDGIAMGLASCPYPDCVEMKGTPQPHGANGKVQLGTVFIGTDQEGLLELSFEHLKFVDSSGNEIAVNIPQSKIRVQVGPSKDASFSAPASTWNWSASPGTAAKLDITGEGEVNYADAMEAAFEWQLGREQGQPCGLANDLSRDVNGDGCIDVLDLQTILANTTGASKRTHLPNPSNPKETVLTADAQAVAAAALVFTVNSTADAADSNIGDGICSSASGCTLRAAINEANSHAGPDTILFNIPGTGVQTIQLNSRLPSLFDASGGTTIDGYSQPGAQPNTDSLVSNAQIRIQIRGNGSSAFNSLVIQSAGNRLQGLAFYNTRRSIWISGTGAQNNLILGNFLGTNAAGTFAFTQAASDANGVHISLGTAGNQVGGPAPADRNVISGNALDGIAFYSEQTINNQIMNNLIGLAPGGNQRLSNLKHGIDMNSGASYNIIGGTTVDKRNIIAGNGQLQIVDYVAGVEISHTTMTTNNQIIGNCFGTDPTCNTGPSWAANASYGVRLQDGVNNNIVAGNVIGNNLRGGIRETGGGTDNNKIYNNRIGISLNGTAIPNGDFGIQLGNSTKLTTIGPNNIIANNPTGIVLLDEYTDRHTITQNSIFNNDRLGIDLSPLGVTPNDSGDADSGPNQGLNFPVLSSATTTQVTGTACADFVVPKPCRIEVFIAERKTSDSGSGNYGQGRTFVGSGTTDTNGSFAIVISGVTAGQYLTATATDASGDTSEFSKNIQVGSGGGGTTTYAADQFSRTVNGGWGSADTGGSYSLAGGSSNFNVNGSTGQMVVQSAGGVLTAKLSGVTALDLNFVFRVKTDKLPAGSNQCAYFVGRSIASNTEYRGQIRIGTNNAIYIRATKALNGIHTMLGTEYMLPGLTYSPGTYIWMRGQVVGTNPTTIRLKAWADGQAEPSSWQFTVTDFRIQPAKSWGCRSALVPVIRRDKCACLVHI